MNLIKKLQNISNNYTLLYLEDDTQLREQLERSFNRLFKKCYSVENGEEGLKFCDTHQVDLIITDINMPIVNGIEFIEKIKDSKNPIPAILVISAYNEDGYIEKLEQLNIKNRLTKPVDKDQLIETLYDICIKDCEIE